MDTFTMVYVGAALLVPLITFGVCILGEKLNH